MKTFLLLFIGMLLGVAVATIGHSILFAQSGNAIDSGLGVTTFGGSGLYGSITDIGPGVKAYRDSSGRYGTITDNGLGVTHYSFGPPVGAKDPC